ncbi:unnamed protein product, partial [Discosporangium mesarthrocarpum]
MTPVFRDLTSPQTVNRTCTFGNKGQLQARAKETMELETKGVGGKRISLQLKNVLWVTGLPCRLPSTGVLRRDGGEFVDSGIRESYLQLSGKTTKIPLEEKGAFLTLQAFPGSIRTDRAEAHVTFTNKHQKLTLRDWHDILGHINPTAIKHLEKRGLIHITDSTVASE